MLSQGHILAILVVSVSLITVLGIDAQQELTIPAWVKNNALWWGQGEITDADFISALNFLIEKDHIKAVSSADSEEYKQESQQLRSKINSLMIENEQLEQDISILEKDVSRLTREYNELYDEYILYYDLYYGLDSTYSDYAEPELNPEDYCSGYADCFIGEVTRVIDGDTIEVDSQSIRFALVNAPEIGAYGGTQAKNFVESVCPVGSFALVDEDDGQTQGSYGRTIAVVYCNDTGYNLNEAVIASSYATLDTHYCSYSEFGDHYWAVLYGCGYEEPSYEAPKSTPPKSEPPKSSPPESTPTPSCDPSYPDFCIPPPPPDLNCSDISQKRFTVLPPDPHHFDGDKDGIGCES